MERIRLTENQVQDLVQRLRGSKEHPSERSERALHEAGILPESVGLELVDKDSLARLDRALVRCAGCDTYQPAEDMSESGGSSFCSTCVSGLLYRHSSGG